jgi:hypothetical protein
MKKVLLSTVAIAALALASCGKSACDCASEIEELGKKALKGDESAIEELEALEDDCKDYKAEDYEDCE